MRRYIISRTNLTEANFANLRIVRNEEVLQKEDENLLIAVLRSLVA